MNALGMPELGIVVVILLIGVLSLVSLGLIVWAVIDMAGHTEAEFTAHGHSKTAWLVGTLVLTLLCGLGWIPALIYLVSIRPKFRRR